MFFHKLIIFFRVYIISPNINLRFTIWIILTVYVTYIINSHLFQTITIAITRLKSNILIASIHFCCIDDIAYDSIVKLAFVYFNTRTDLICIVTNIFLSIIFELHLSFCTLSYQLLVALFPKRIELILEHLRFFAIISYNGCKLMGIFSLYLTDVGRIVHIIRIFRVVLIFFPLIWWLYDSCLNIHITIIYG